METLAEVSERYEFAVLEHLEADAEVPVLGGLQAQGDLIIVPQHVGNFDRWPPVPATGIPVIEAAGGGHEHRLFAGTPGTARFDRTGATGQDIGYLACTAPAYVLHPEHGAAGIAPGAYVLRRQREHAGAEQRLVAD